MKVMVILLYDCDGVILTHTVPQWQTINVQYYCSFLEHNLRLALRKKRRHLTAEPTNLVHEFQEPQGTNSLLNSAPTREQLHF
jgi:hypothetical protein